MFLDANILIHAYGVADRKGQACATLMTQIIQGEQKASTSVMVINEVLYFFLQSGGPQRAREVWVNIRKITHLKILGVGEDSIERAIRHMESGLDTTDAFHAAVMDSDGTGVICSYDRAFDKIKTIRRQEPK